jgi:UDP-N-acetylmuramoyl-tripeptide--D-alanyl-D-alanine ligase
MMTVTEAARALGARAVGTDVTFDSVSTDSRNIRKGDLFIAIRGERFDGHRFVTDAARAGAVAAMVDEDSAPGRGTVADLSLIVVKDSRRALGALGAYWRGKFSMPLVGLTGSSGKTTVKEMLAGILRTAVSDDVDEAEVETHVLATRGNLNNDLGVPLTLLQLKSHHRYAVIEMGMNHAGEIRYLSQMARPDVALVNNAGSAHIEYLGSREAIACAKGEIYEGLKADGVAVINADDTFAPLWRELVQGKAIVEFGLKPGTPVTASYALHPLESEIVLKTPLGEAATTIKAPGLHNVRNALAAAAAATALHVAPQAIAAGLGRFAGIKGRLQLRRTVGGAMLIDDTYNANPESVRAAIAVLAQSAGKKVLVLGDMGELGADAPRLHSEIGEAARLAGVDSLLTLGEASARSSETFGSGATHFQRIEELLAELEDMLAPGVTVLVKGSRFMEMERVVKALGRTETAAGAVTEAGRR